MDINSPPIVSDKSSRDDNGIDTGYDEDEADDIPYSWQIFQQPNSNPEYKPIQTLHSSLTLRMPTFC